MSISLQNLPRRLLKGANRSILTNAGSLAGTTAITSGLGFVYWWLAARQFAPAVVGLGAAAVSSMMLLANVGTLGLGTWLMGELPQRRGNQSSLIVTVLVLAGVSGAVLGLGCAALAPRLSSDLKPLGESLASIGLFAAGVSLTTITLVLDQVFIGLLQGGVQMWRNALFAIVKLVALAAVGFWWMSGGGLVIYATWAIGTAVSLAVVLTLKSERGTRVRPGWALLRGKLRTTLSHHALNMALQLPTLALPMAVAFVLSAAMNAYFYTTWMLAGFVFTGPFALTLALYSVAAADPARLKHRIRFTLGISLALGLLANAFLWLTSDWLLGLFGAAYAAQGAATLRILGLAVFGLIVKDHYVAVHRVVARLTRAAVLVALGGIVELLLAVLGAILGGLPGLALGWVIAICAEAALMAPSVYAAALPDSKETRLDENELGPLERVRASLF